MVTIDVRELEEHPAEVVRQVKSCETVQLVEGGRTVATITPVTAAAIHQLFVDETLPPPEE